MTMRRLILLALAAALLFALGMAVASAAPDHQWIIDGGFRNVSGTSCCGAEHCKPIDESAIQWTNDGAIVTYKDSAGKEVQSVVPNAAIKPSQDPLGRYWFCVTGCLFTPARA